MESPSGFFSGIKRGTGSLITGVGGGVVNSVASIVGTASSTLSSAGGVITGDARFNREREEMRRENKANHGGVLSGFIAGGESVAHGFVSGITGLVTKPMEEGAKSGALGFLKGVGMGLGGVVVKPLIGVTDGVANVAQGFSQQVTDKKVLPNIRPSRTFEYLTGGESSDKVLVSLDLFAAEMQQFVARLAKAKGNLRDTYRSYCVLGFNSTGVDAKIAGIQPPISPYAVVVSDLFIYLVNRDTSMMWDLSFNSISHFTFNCDNNTGLYFINIVVYQQSDSAHSPGPRSISCASKMHAIRVYKMLCSYFGKMGNPGAVIPIEKILAQHNSSLPDLHDLQPKNQQHVSDKNSMGGNMIEDLQSSASTADIKQSSAAIYQFGSANRVAVRCSTINSKDLVSRSEARFLDIQAPKSISNAIHKGESSSDENSYRKILDEEMWNIVSNWRHNHSQLHNSARCEIILLLNHSSNHVQILNIEMKEGRDFAVLAVGQGYDKNSRNMSPRCGAVVLFGYAKTPSLMDPAHIKLDVTTTAFSGRFSTRPNGMFCKDVGGFTTGFLERSVTEHWAKVVVRIT
jgi:hypothetical protein